jgi:hypothetical protein
MLRSRAHDPAVVGMPTASILSLRRMGTPSRYPRDLPSLRRASDAAACCRASGAMAITPFKGPSYMLMRSI